MGGVKPSPQVSVPTPLPEPPPPAPPPRQQIVQEALPPPPAAGASPLPQMAGVPGAPVRAALLLPLSGPSAAMGAALLNAAQLALFEVAADNFVLLPIDTKSTPDGALAAANQAVGQGANIILGPVFSAEVKAAAPAARAAGVNILAFTTDRTAAGDGVFLMGFLPRPQVARVVSYARSQGLTRFAALAPDTEFGHAVADALRAAVMEGGGLVTQVEFYDPGAKDFGEPVKRLARGRDFQALLLPDDGTRLRNVAALLSFHGLDSAQVRMLGTMLWSDPRLASEPALVGGWFPAPSSATYNGFEQRYAKAYGTKPPRIAGNAFDATALAAMLAKRAQADFSAATLTMPSGFAGVDGIFRLLPDGTSERGLAVMEITPSGPQEIAPAPDSFERVGN